MEKTRFFRASTDRGVVVATIQVAPRNIRILRDCAGVAAALLIISIFSYYRLLGTPWQIDFSAAFQGIRPVLGATFFAALKIWTFWALTAAVIAGVQLKLDPGIDSFDALLGGVAGAWMAAYILGQVLGPIGLFRAPVIWILLIASGAWIFFTPTQFVMPRLTPGRAMAMLAFALVMVGLIPLQLGSPAAPYMDVMSYPASVQRILSFGRYLPFDNDPYGCWGPQAQTPGLELFLAMLAMGSRVKFGLLAHSATIVPMAGLIIFGAYRLGAATLGDAAGGVASLMLFFTNTFRRAVGVRGTAVAFALVGVGLGLVLDRRARRSTFALGCLILGAAVASHTIDGGFAIAVASFAILLRDATRPQILLLKGVCLFGSVLVAAPDLAISTKTVLAYPILPMLQIAGIGAIVFAARALPEPELGDDESPSAYDPRSYNVAMFAIFLVVLAYTLTRVPDSIYAQIFQQFPLLSAFAAMGLLVDRNLARTRSQIDRRLAADNRAASDYRGRNDRAQAGLDGRFGCLPCRHRRSSLQVRRILDPLLSGVSGGASICSSLSSRTPCCGSHCGARDTHLPVESASERELRLRRAFDFRKLGNRYLHCGTWLLGFHARSKMDHGTG